MPIDFPLLNISNCQSVLKYRSINSIFFYIYMTASYLTKFDFMNYAFAKLVVAW